MIKDRSGDSSIVAHARRELEMAKLFEKKEDYDGSLGRGALALIKVFDQWAKGDGPMMQSLHQLFNGLVSGELLSPPTDDPEEWEDISREDQQIWRNRRSPFYVTTDIKLRTWTNLATHERGACKNHITGEVPKYEPPVDKEEKPTAETPDKASDAGVSPAGDVGGEAKADEKSNSNSSSEAGRRGNTSVDPESVETPPRKKSGKAKPKKGEAK